MFNFLKRNLSPEEKKLAELRALQVTLAVLLGLLLAGGLAIWQITKDEGRVGELRQQAVEANFDQRIPPGSTIGGPFQLVNQDGAAVTDASYKGKYLLIYFGYTYCPDVCPTGLQSMAHALDQLGAEVSKVQPLYITIDPARDTPSKIKEYIGSFHPQIVGLTGTPEQIAAVAKAYQVYYAKSAQVDEQDYLMDHSSRIYLMDPNGKLVATFPQEVDPAIIVKTLQENLAKTPT